MNCCEFRNYEFENVIILQYFLMCFFVIKLILDHFINYLKHFFFYKIYAILGMEKMELKLEGKIGLNSFFKKRKRNKI
ncbi:hypothetical protein EV145_104183 [Flavobacterium sp. 245]|nr:hypothetical protein EV145_104183 [Flavobacterium sp. 245]